MTNGETRQTSHVLGCGTKLCVAQSRRRWLQHSEAHCEAGRGELVFQHGYARLYLCRMFLSQVHSQALVSGFCCAGAATQATLLVDVRATLLVDESGAIMPTAGPAAGLHPAHEEDDICEVQSSCVGMYLCVCVDAALTFLHRTL